ncbi:MAG: head-tail connector protein [Cohaesibacter sp.]|nr:head-tail connector protein [Cohaesibacter sp.]
MMAKLITPPAKEPVSLEDMKAYLKQDSSAEDDLLSALIIAARSYLEQVTGRHFLSQIWQVTLKVTKEREISLPFHPVQRLVSLAALTDQGDLTALDLGDFKLEQHSNPAIIKKLQSSHPPSAGRLVIQLETGFGGQESDVPPPILQALKMIVSRWFDCRGISNPSDDEAINVAVSTLIAPYRTVRL